MSPPNAETMPATTEIGPNCRPVKKDRYAPAPMNPRRTASATETGSVGMVAPVTTKIARKITAVTDCIPAVARRLPTTRLTSAVMTS